MNTISKSTEAKRAIYKKQAEKIISILRKRNMDGAYFEDTREAIAEICKMIPKGSLVGLGGSETIIDSGLIDRLRYMDINLMDRYKEGVSKERINEMRREGLLSDIFIASSNAITLDGKLVNMDGIGNRVACMIYGPKKVILMIGMNKVVKGIPEAIARIRAKAAPMDAIRVNLPTPCSKTGICQDPDCYPPNRICSQLSIIESSMIPNRIFVVLTAEEFGF